MELLNILKEIKLSNLDSKVILNLDKEVARLIEGKENLIEYIEEYAWEWSKLHNTTLTQKQKTDRIGEKLILPEEAVNNLFVKSLTKN